MAASPHSDIALHTWQDEPNRSRRPLAETTRLAMPAATGAAEGDYSTRNMDPVFCIQPLLLWYRLCESECRTLNIEVGGEYSREMGCNIYARGGRVDENGRKRKREEMANPKGRTLKLKGWIVFVSHLDL